MGQKEQASAVINRDALELIRAGFRDAGMTQVELSKATGIPRSTLANILSPTAAPRLIHVEQMVKVAIALGIDFRQWAQELEARERGRLGASASGTASSGTASRTGRSRPPQIQKRAARGR